jgi:hypothetical protein
MMSDVNQLNSDSLSNTGIPRPHWLKRFLRIPKLAEWIAMVFAVCAALMGLADHFAAKSDVHDLVSLIVVGTALIGLLLFAFVQSESLRVFVEKDEKRSNELFEAQRQLAEARLEIAHVRTAESRIARCISDAAQAKAQFHLDAMTILSAGYYEHDPARIRHGTN